MVWSSSSFWVQISIDAIVLLAYPEHSGISASFSGPSLTPAIVDKSSGANVYNFWRHTQQILCFRVKCSDGNFMIRLLEIGLKLWLPPPRIRFLVWLFRGSQQCTKQSGWHALYTMSAKNLKWYSEKRRTWNDATNGTDYSERNELKNDGANRTHLKWYSERTDLKWCNEWMQRTIASGTNL